MIKLVVSFLVGIFLFPTLSSAEHGNGAVISPSELNKELKNSQRPNLPRIDQKRVDAFIKIFDKLSTAFSTRKPVWDTPATRKTLTKNYQWFDLKANDLQGFVQAARAAQVPNSTYGSLNIGFLKGFNIVAETAYTHLAPEQDILIDEVKLRKKIKNEGIKLGKIIQTLAYYANRSNWNHPPKEKEVDDFLYKIYTLSQGRAHLGEPSLDADQKAALHLIATDIFTQVRFNQKGSKFYTRMKRLQQGINNIRLGLSPRLPPTKFST